MLEKVAQPLTRRRGRNQLRQLPAPAFWTGGRRARRHHNRLKIVFALLAVIVVNGHGLVLKPRARPVQFAATSPALAQSPALYHLRFTTRSGSDTSRLTPLAHAVPPVGHLD